MHILVILAHLSEEIGEIENGHEDNSHPTAVFAAYDFGLDAGIQARSDEVG